MFAKPRNVLPYSAFIDLSCTPFKLRRLYIRKMDLCCPVLYTDLVNNQKLHFLSTQFECGWWCNAFAFKTVSFVRHYMCIQIPGRNSAKHDGSTEKSKHLKFNSPFEVQVQPPNCDIDRKVVTKV